MANTLLDRTETFLSLWFLALSNVCMNLNYTASASIKHAISMQVLTGVTPGISSLLQFDWYEPVYYKIEENHFPSMSNEHGHFVGISEHVGHVLAYPIFNGISQKVIHHSVVQSMTSLDAKHQTADIPSDSEPQKHI